MSESFEEVWKKAEADFIANGCSLAGLKAWAFLGLRHAAHMEGYREGYERGRAIKDEDGNGRDLVLGGDGIDTAAYCHVGRRR